MLKKQSIKKNFFYQVVYQGLIYVIPLVLSPFLTRTLLEKSLGIYSYVNSIASYFVILAMLGIAKYGQRVVSQASDNSELLRKQFWSLYYLHGLISIVSLIAYCLFIKFFIREYRNIYIIEGIFVLSAFFDITWLFYGLENFRSVVIKNTIVKILELILCFALVKKPNDLWIYTFINSGAILLGQIIMIPQAVRLVKPIYVSKSEVRNHIKPMLMLSVSVIAISLYTVFDKTLIGLITTKENVAFYEYANKIINIPFKDVWIQNYKTRRIKDFIKTDEKCIVLVFRHSFFLFYRHFYQFRHPER
mgnify:CR=1 FL=1